MGRLPTCYAPVRHFTCLAAFSFDLHVLGTPPALVLSQDQTLQLIFQMERFRSDCSVPGSALLSVRPDQGRIAPASSRFCFFDCPLVSSLRRARRPQGPQKTGVCYSVFKDRGDRSTFDLTSE